MIRRRDLEGGVWGGGGGGSWVTCGVVLWRVIHTGL